MVIKWIRCRVPEASRSAFATAQRSWSALRGLPGFLGQVGGWRAGDETEAIILALWRDRRTYDAFMSERHDAIAEESGQAATYRQCEVAIFDELIRLPGLHPSLESALSGTAGSSTASEAGFLRAADCVIRPGRGAHFERMQRSIWLAAMQGAEGMLAGAFAGDAESESRRLVVTLWTDEAAHARYVCDLLPGLRARSDVDLDVESIDAVYAQLEPGW